MRALYGISGGVSLGLAWHFPSTLVSVFSGWIATFFIVLIAKNFLLQCNKPNFSLKKELLYGCILEGSIAQLIACYWLFNTVQDFAHFSSLLGILTLLLFALAHGVQLSLFYLFLYLTKGRFSKSLLLIPISWVVAQYLFPSLFPWDLGHTQLLFRPLARLADISGVWVISFLMVFLVSKITLSRLIVACFALLYGWIAQEQVYQEIASAPKVKVGIVQANVTIEETESLKVVVTDMRRYKELSKPFANTNTLIVWPEAVVQEWIPADARNIRSARALPDLSAPAIMGSLSYDFQPTGAIRYNSSFGLTADGVVLPPYHKRVLMPFGEYLPLEDKVPFLKRLNPGIGGLTPGKEAAIFNFKVGDQEVKGAPLICYEDVVPGLSREVVRKGANLLVNLTNDAWFGRSIAPSQHHLIASFRAIENRRTLIRSTNTGLSAVVLPSGESVGAIPPHSEGVSLVEVPLLHQKSGFVMIGSLPQTLLAIIVLIVSIYEGIQGWKVTR